MGEDSDESSKADSYHAVSSAKDQHQTTTSHVTDDNNDQDCEQVMASQYERGPSTKIQNILATQLTQVHSFDDGDFESHEDGGKKDRIGIGTNCASCDGTAVKSDHHVINAVGDTNLLRRDQTFYDTSAIDRMLSSGNVMIAGDDNNNNSENYSNSYDNSNEKLAKSSLDDAATIAGLKTIVVSTMRDKRQKRKTNSLLKRRTNNKQEPHQSINQTDAPCSTTMLSKAHSPSSGESESLKCNSLTVPLMPSVIQKPPLTAKMTLGNKKLSSISNPMKKKIRTNDSKLNPSSPHNYIIHKDNKSTKQNTTMTTANNKTAPTPFPPPPHTPAAKTTTTTTKKRNFQDQILYHMLLTEKPYTLKTLAQSTRSSEEALYSVMLSLIDKNFVHKKENATSSSSSSAKRTKSRILYWANQYHRNITIPQASPDDFRSATEHHDRLVKRHRIVSGEVRRVLTSSGPSNDELDEILIRIERDVKELRGEIKDVKRRVITYDVVEVEDNGATTKNNNDTKTTTTRKTMNNDDYKTEAATTTMTTMTIVHCSKTLKKTINKWRNEWTYRKGMCIDFVEILVDAMETKTMRDVIRLLGVETDEKVGVMAMPAKHDI